MDKTKLVISLALLLCASCTKKNAETTPKELHIFTWSDYLRPEVIAEFEKEQNAKVKLDFLSSNEELLAKIQLSLQSGGPGYDLIQPSDYMVATMRRLNILKPLDKNRLTFLKDFDPSFQHPAYDPELALAIPFAWGTTGIAVNTKLAPKFDAKKGLSWRDLFENPSYKGKTTLLDDPKEALYLVLRILGKPAAQASEQDVKDAFAYLKKYKSNLRVITTEVRPLIEAGDCVLCHAYSGDVLSAAKEKPEIQYVVPLEGATLWTDNFALPQNAVNIDLAYAFLNKLLSAEGAKRFTEATHYATANVSTQKLLPKNLAENLFIFPDAALKAKLQFLPERPELTTLIEKLWTELKSQ